MIIVYFYRYVKDEAVVLRFDDLQYHLGTKRLEDSRSLLLSALQKVSDSQEPQHISKRVTLHHSCLHFILSHCALLIFSSPVTPCAAFKRLLSEYMTYLHYEFPALQCLSAPSRPFPSRPIIIVCATLDVAEEHKESYNTKLYIFISL